MADANDITRRQFVASAVSVLVLADLPAGATTDSAMQPTTKKDEAPMTTLTPYLLFNGTCLQAMEFYKSCFGGELTAVKVKDSPAKDYMPPALHDRTVDARLRSSNLDISASDWLRPDVTPVRGNTVCLYLSGGTFSELKSIFEKLSDGADVTDPLKEMFFGTYGALNDKFGVRWMFQANKTNP
jgi:PhnB protein